MSRRKKICVMTSSRAEYGQIYWLLKTIQRDPTFRLQLVVTGAHLWPKFGLSYRDIVRDGFKAAQIIRVPLQPDTPFGVATMMAHTLVGFARAFKRLRPDWFVLLGDRYETWAAAQAAYVARIPIAHFCGGDTTEGVLDEQMRHSITKMAQLHFVTNPISAKRVRQLGEDPHRIFVVGNPALDQLKHLKSVSLAKLEKTLAFRFRKKNLLVTFHPATLEEEAPGKQFKEILVALDSLGQDVGLIFTKPNADAGSDAIRELLDRYVARRSNAAAYASLGSPLYLHIMKRVDAVVGNSSSGITETPSFAIPTVNIGSRQKGRLCAASVIHCDPRRQAIRRALQRALHAKRRRMINPYGDGRASLRAVKILKKIRHPRALLQKHFFDQGKTS